MKWVPSVSPPFAELCEDGQVTDTLWGWESIGEHDDVTEVLR